MGLEVNKKDIINKLLENKFDVDNLKEVCSKVLNIPVKNGRPYDNIYEVFKEYVETYQEIAEHIDSEKNKIYILAVKIKEEKDPVKARIKQREFIANILRERKKRGALVAFYNDNYNHWRISVIKLDYEFTVKGVKEDLTPAKRLSYVIGKGETCRTAKDQFYSLLDLKDEQITLNKLEEIFALEKVTNEFFKEYKNKYLDIKETLIKDKNFMNEAKKHDTEKPESFAEGFAKKLMGQLAFIYFLQKKGWLGIQLAPDSLTYKEYMFIYDKALEDEKKVLDKVYERINIDTFILNKKSLSNLDNKSESELLGKAFSSIPYFKDWGTGDKNFIRNLYEKHKKEDVNNEKTFFEDYLEKLFYNNLSEERGKIQYSVEFNSRIPFLNGGLFDPYGDYKWKETKFNLQDELFSNNDGTGILDIFDRYNFTVNENDSYEAEVAVDPEMLGKVFENLLDVSDRKSKGAFYTPREIVRYMTNESIMNYLLNNLEGKDITKNDLEYVFNLGEFTKEYDQQIFEREFLEEKKPLKDEKGNSRLGMPRNIIIHSKLIDDLLAKVKIADPACGSGAFPLGILNEIVRARYILQFYIHLLEFFLEKDEKKYWAKKNKSMYSLKLDTIQNCLYGVDIEPSAIDITKLRLWLSIIVDSSNFDVKPLPNLDFNFMIGNSLVDEFEGIKLFDEKLLKNTKKKYSKKTTAIKIGFSFEDTLENYFNMQKEFFNPYVKNKSFIKNQLLDLEYSLIEKNLKENYHENILKELKKIKTQRIKPYFIWKLFYGKVFMENEGFDIVIGNPPYIGEDGNKEKFREIAQTEFGKRNYMGKMDYFYFFFHLGLDLLKDGGILSFITTNYFLTADGAKKLREDLKRRSYLLNLLNFNEYKIFDSAKGQHNIITILEKKNKKIKKERNSENFICNRKGNKNSKILDNILLRKDLETNYFSIEQDNIFEGEHNFIRVNGVQLKTGTVLDSILDKMMKELCKLSSVVQINQGVVSGCDKVSSALLNKITKNIDIEIKDGIFVFDLNNTRDSYFLMNLTKDEKNLFKPFFKNSEIFRYIANEIPQKYLLYLNKEIKEIDSFHNIKKYLSKFEEILLDRREAKNGKIKYFHLQWGREKNIFYGEKLVCPYRSKKNIFAYTDKEWFCRSDVYIIKKISEKISLKFLLALLNSKLYYIWLFNKGKRKGDILELFPTSLYEIPIKIVSDEEQQKYVQIVERIIELKKLDKDTQELENQIDEMVYDLYELTEEEKELVRNF